VTHRAAVQVEQVERSAPLLAQLGPAAPELDGGLVEERDPAVNIGRVDGDGDGIEERAIRRLGRLGLGARLDDMVAGRARTGASGLHQGRCFVRVSAGAGRMS